MAPSITFISDIFHPLVTPLTTYTYTTGSLNSDTVSATDEERLPPGGFSLRHGFPSWFGRAQKNVVLRTSSGNFAPSDEHPRISKVQDASSQLRSASIVEVLQYMKCTFEEESSLDALPLEAAGNPGAWNAWRSHRKSTLSNPTSASTLRNSPHHQEEWSWEGVWEERVQKGVQSSISDAVVYGNVGGGDTLVCPQQF